MPRTGHTCSREVPLRSVLSAGRCSAALLAAMAVCLGEGRAAEPFPLTLRWQHETSPGSGRFHIRERAETWNPAETAIIVCDVWDYHHSLNAVRRLEEFAPRLDRVLQVARERGATIIHSPSDCMAAYADHPARKRAQNTPPAARMPHDVGAWCSAIPAEERAVYPIDQSDGGDDDDPAEHAVWAQKLIELGRDPGLPWQRQSDLITIDDERDFLSDRGDEVWNVLADRGIKNVILTGVHVNMCVLGRPFGLRQMARNGMHVVLMRDLTDAMYNPRQWPYVSHFAGNDLVIDHIERFVCPTITSDQFLGGEPFRFSTDTRPHVVMVIAEDPYHTRTTLPAFALGALGRDFRVTILHADERDPHRIPYFEAIDSADVLLLSVRRRVLPEADLERLRKYVAAGKPVIGIRTSSHAFALRDGTPPAGYAVWPEFDADVFGGNYRGSYPDALRSTIEASSPRIESELLRGVIDDLPFVQGGHMYQTGPLRPGAEILLQGRVAGHDPEPVAWTFTRRDGGRSFYVALGDRADFDQPAFVRLLTNAVYWGAGQPVPEKSVATISMGAAGPYWVTLPFASIANERAPQGDDSPGWSRCVIRLPAEWVTAGGLELRFADTIELKNVSGWFNGREMQAAGRGTLAIPEDAAIPDDHNLLVLRNAAPPLSAAPVLTTPDGTRRLSLDGRWQFRGGDDRTWANMPLPAKFGGSADIVHAPDEPLWTARPLTRPGEFTPGIEGPACDRDGNVYAVNYERQGTIGRVTPAGAGEIFIALPEGSVGNGIRFDAAGFFYVADYAKHNVLRVDPRTRKIDILAHNPAMNQPNDLAIADDGTLYASDPDWTNSTGQLWRIDTDGTTTLLAKDLGTTNGLDLSPDGKTLYVNESVQRNVWAFTITTDRTLTDKRLVRQFEDHGFDGMRTDVDGNLYITRYGKGTVVKMSPEGEILREIDVLGERPSNLCFGGPDGRTVYVTEVEHTRLVRFRVDRPGRSWKQQHAEEKP